MKSSEKFWGKGRASRPAPAGQLHPQAILPASCRQVWLPRQCGDLPLRVLDDTNTLREACYPGAAGDCSSATHGASRRVRRAGPRSPLAPVASWSGASTPDSGIDPPGAAFNELGPGFPRACGDQTNVRCILIRADGPGRQSCHLRRSVQLRPKARGDRSATQEAQAQRKAVPRVRRTERTQARNVFAVCRDSNGWLARPAPRGACCLERKPCGSFIRHRARKHPTGGGMSRRLSGCDRDRRGAKDSPMQHSLTRESGIGARQMSRADVVSDDRRRVMAVTFRAANCHSVRSSGITAYLKLNVATIVVRPGDRGAQEAAQHEPPDRTAEDSQGRATEKIRFEGGTVRHALLRAGRSGASRSLSVQRGVPRRAAGLIGHGGDRQRIDTRRRERLRFSRFCWALLTESPREGSSR